MNSELLLASPIVSVAWLQKHLSHPNLVILNATIPKVTGNDTNLNEYQIPSTRFFDLKNKFSDVSAPFPTTFPSEEQFELEAQNLGINKKSTIVVYDEKGIYSSPRAWWLFKAFGFNNIAVLNGGFPAWIKSDYPTENKQNNKVEKGDFKAKLQPNYMKFFENIKRETQDNTHLIVDARSEGRFKALESEPREGLRSGKIPNSINLPYENLIDAYGLLKSDIELKQLFQPFQKKTKHLLFLVAQGLQLVFWL
ncbi:sulfurtransferase [Xanthomarina sp. F2636L]|uniref:sulfurtransferase n=1 Tax=Xanthomarina sp. F2636L TaxID=2996018 RepID=UPI00225E69EB|nr:rhodanese-like domain-containing protein [Xanthomarina sp. F2636L]MCX7549704.1 rhodanese-like domain-containing protein [Xanthomarina sp. F2636L]